MTVSLKLKRIEAEVEPAPQRKRSSRRKYLYKKPRRKRAASNRKCRICGKDPYPNYFFCPSCHRRIDNFEEI